MGLFVAYIGCSIDSVTLVLILVFFLGPGGGQSVGLVASCREAVAAPEWIARRHRAHLVALLVGDHTQELGPLFVQLLCLSGQLGPTRSVL